MTPEITEYSIANCDLELICFYPKCLNLFYLGMYYYKEEKIKIGDETKWKRKISK